MIFNKHSNLEGSHALFSPSSPGWLRYDDEKIMNFKNNMEAKKKGTRLHAWAKETIDLGIKQSRTKKTLPMYINDAIGFRMNTEQVLYYSDEIYGTADAISFRDGQLRIHDLKTGKVKANMEQLIVYAALFCLEYNIDPKNIDIELRIYQSDQILYYEPEASEIKNIMDIIVHVDKITSF